MYIVLGILYELYSPDHRYLTLPTAGVGALLALMIAGSELDVIAIIGIILLIGIVKKNAIMMMTYGRSSARARHVAAEAIYRLAVCVFVRS